MQYSKGLVLYTEFRMSLNHIMLVNGCFM